MRPAVHNLLQTNNIQSATLTVRYVGIVVQIEPTTDPVTELMSNQNIITGYCGAGYPAEPNWCSQK